jgi:rhodanese-related sulfurtransferase
MSLPNAVVALENGTMGWALAGLELERGANRWAPPVSERSRAAAVLAAKRVAAEDGVHFVAPEDLARLWQRRDEDNVCVLDVRTAEEYAAGHIAGAVSIPHDQIEDRLREVPRDREVVAYCRGPYCTLAATAVRILSAAGFRARHLDLGVPDLRARRFPISTRAPAPAVRRRAALAHRASRSPDTRAKRKTP